MSRGPRNDKRGSSARLLLLCASALLLLAGCTQPPQTPTTPVEEPEAANTASVRTGVFRVELTTTHKSFRASEFIPLKLSLHNAGTSDVMVEFPTAQKFDLVAQTEGGEQVWRWSKGRTFAQMVKRTEMVSGEGRNFYERIPADTLKPGQYRIIGEITAAELAGVQVSVQVEVK